MGSVAQNRLPPGLHDRGCSVLTDDTRPVECVAWAHDVAVDDGGVLVPAAGHVRGDGGQALDGLQGPAAAALAHRAVLHGLPGADGLHLYRFHHVRSARVDEAVLRLVQLVEAAHDLVVALAEGHDDRRVAARVLQVHAAHCPHPLGRDVLLQELRLRLLREAVQGGHQRADECAVEGRLHRQDPLG